MRAAIYARVSSSAQRERHTIASQLSTLPAFVAAQGWTLGGTYVDDGKTAKAGHMEARDGFTRLLADMLAGKYDVVVVVDQDRLTRSEDLRERGEVLGAFQRAGVKIAVASTGQVLDLGSSMGDLLSTLQAFFAAESNRKHRERITRGKLEAIRAGRKPAGPTPFGYLYDRATATWSVDPELGPVVVEIFTRVAAGDSCETIAREFEVRGIMRSRLSGAHGRHIARWSRERVWQVAVARTYLGVWTADKAKHLTVPVPRIVSDELYDAARDSLIRYGKRGLDRTKHFPLCSSVGVCGLCGGRVGVTGGGPSNKVDRAAGMKSLRYYICGNRRRPEVGAPRCHLPMRRVEKVDAALWAEICRALEQPERLSRALKRRKSGASQEAHNWAKDLAGYRRHLERLARTEEAILERFQRELVSEAALDTSLGRIGAERRMVELQVAQAEKATARVGRVESKAVEVLATIANLRPRLEGTTAAQRAAFVRKLVPVGGLTLMPDGSVETTLVIQRAQVPTGVVHALGSGCSSKREDDVRIPLRITG